MRVLVILACCFVAGFALPQPPSHEQYRRHQVYRVLPEQEKDLAFLKALFEREVLNGEFWTEPHGVGHSVDIQVSPEHAASLVAALEDQNINHSIMIEDLAENIAENYRSNYHAKQQIGRRVFDDYMEYDEMMDWVAMRAEDCGDRCDLFGIGQTYEGREMMVLKITDGSGDINKPALWVDSGIHAREWIAFAMGCWVIDQLVDNVDAEDILRRFDVFVLPAINADGYIYTHTTNRMWRKSRKPNQGTTCIGTDINRNFDHEWATVGVGTNPCSETWPGDNAYSEPEAENVANYIENNVPAGGWKLFLTLHSYSQLWMAPWGYTTDQPPNMNDLERAGEAAVDALREVHGTVFRFGSASTILYPSSGTSRDWAYGVPQIPYVYTVELRDTGSNGFILPPSQIIPSGEEFWEGFKAMVRAME